MLKTRLILLATALALPLAAPARAPVHPAAKVATKPATTPAAEGNVYPHGMVSAADPRAAAAGAEMLRQGGSATDAALR